MRFTFSASCSPGWLGNRFYRDGGKSKVLQLLAALPSLWLFGLCSFQRGQCPIWGWERVTRGYRGLVLKATVTLQGG